MATLPPRNKDEMQRLLSQNQAKRAEQQRRDSAISIMAVNGSSHNGSDSAYDSGDSPDSENNSNSADTPESNSADSPDNSENNSPDNTPSSPSEHTSFHSDEYPQLPINYPALYHIARHFLPGSHGKVLRHSPLSRGSFHEVCVLHFADGWKCVARFKRNREQSLAYAESELATMEFVRRETNLPVPEVYLVEHSEASVVGCAFMLMEWRAGRELWSFCMGLGREGKRAVVRAWAGIVVELAKCKFDVVGSLNGAGGKIGAVQDNRYGEDTAGRGPFASFEAYVADLMGLYKTKDRELKRVQKEVEGWVRAFFERGNRAVEEPYRLVHGDLKVQNLLFHYDEEKPEVLPRLSAVIDWDGSAAFPIYYLFEYPGLIRDLPGQTREVRKENAELRALFEEEVVAGVEEGDKEVARQAFRKEVMLERLLEVFPWKWVDTKTQAGELLVFVEELKAEEAKGLLGEMVKGGW